MQQSYIDIARWVYKLVGSGGVGAVIIIIVSPFAHHSTRSPPSSFTTKSEPKNGDEREATTRGAFRCLVILMIMSISGIIINPFSQSFPKIISPDHIFYDVQAHTDHNINCESMFSSLYNFFKKSIPNLRFNPSSLPNRNIDHDHRLIVTLFKTMNKDTIHQCTHVSTNRIAGFIYNKICLDFGQLKSKNKK